MSTPSDSPSTSSSIEPPRRRSSSGLEGEKVEDEKPTFFSSLNSTEKAPLPSTIALSTSVQDLLTIAAIYPISLLLASLSTSFITPQATYFSHKRNLFNVVFVKHGWLWTTVIYAYHVSRLRRTPPLQAIMRWSLATAWWYFVTQWFFGPPIMDRAFTFTGGACEVAQTKHDVSTPQLLISSAACKLAKGHWQGGHDLSGHVFMLTHASLFLWSELLPLLQMGSERQRKHGATWAVGCLLALWWWMLIMTGVYFHTWREKLTGLLASLLEWGLVYLVSIRQIPVVRDVIGVPGL